MVVLFLVVVMVVMFLSCILRGHPVCKPNLSIIVRARTYKRRSLLENVEIFYLGLEHYESGM